MDNVDEMVAEIVARVVKIHPSRLSLDTDLKTELNVDSLQGLQIIAALEKTFGVSLPDEDLDSYVTLRMIGEALKRSKANV